MSKSGSRKLRPTDLRQLLNKLLHDVTLDADRAKILRHFIKKHFGENINAACKILNVQEMGLLPELRAESTGRRRPTNPFEVKMKPRPPGSGGGRRSEDI